MPGSNGRSASSNESLQVQQVLLNPRFEAYKLASATRYPASTSAYRLPSQIAVSDLNPDPDATLGYKELKDRLDQPQLVPGSSRNQLAYIDYAGFMILVVFERRVS